MPSKKKPKPSFNVPEELQAAPQAGWVYRSDGESKPVEKPKKEAASKPAAGEGAVPEKAAALPAPPVRSAASAEAPAKSEKKKKSSSSGKSDSDSSVLDLASKTISSGFETVGNAMLLATRIITAPIWMGMRLIGMKSK